MKARKKVKLRTLPSKVDKSKILEKKVMKSVRLANERIKSINRKYKDTTYTWSINKLKNLIPEYIKNERIQIPKKIKKSELIDIYKSVESFLNSKQSTKKGIKEVQEKAKDTISSQLFDNELDDETIDEYYSMLEDDDFTNLIDKDFDVSEFWIVIDDAISSNDTLDDFLDRINMYKNVSDEYIRNKAIKLYDKYIK